MFVCKWINTQPGGDSIFLKPNDFPIAVLEYDQIRCSFNCWRTNYPNKRLMHFFYFVYLSLFYLYLLLLFYKTVKVFSIFKPLTKAPQKGNIMCIHPETSMWRGEISTGTFMHFILNLVTKLLQYKQGSVCTEFSSYLCSLQLICSLTDNFRQMFWTNTQ